jgi:hypothetical protein
MHYPQVFFFVLPSTFPGVRVDAPTCNFCFNDFGRNLLFVFGSTTESSSIFVRLSLYSDSRLPELSLRSDIRVILILLHYKAQIVEIVIQSLNNNTHLIDLIKKVVHKTVARSAFAYYSVPAQRRLCACKVTDQMRIPCALIGQSLRSVLATKRFRAAYHHSVCVRYSPRMTDAVLTMTYRSSPAAQHDTQRFQLKHCLDLRSGLLRTNAEILQGRRHGP